ncbi:MAG: substrate-binding domain-containing protein [Desulfarculales bacterium]|jgi:ribose transport system substrate-binding protein|nr:substrate-binding domain-containing protein [Desulfarculales bacterium]
MRRYTKNILVLFLFLFYPISAIGAEDRLILGISIPSADHGWTGGVVWWAEKAIKEIQAANPRLEVIFKQAVNHREQSYDIENMLENNIQALVILPHYPPPLANILRRVHNQGVFIITVDRTAPTLINDVYVAANNYEFGYMCGEYMARASGGQGKLLVMEGVPCDVNTLRVKGFRDAIAAFPAMTVMDSQPAHWSEEKGYELMQNYLAAFSQIDMIWCGDDDVLMGALAAYKQSGRQDVKMMLGGGGSKRVIEMIMAGDPLVPATVTYPPDMIYKAISMASQRLIAGTEYDKEVIVPSQLITKENAEQFYHPDSIY